MRMDRAMRQCVGIFLTAVAFGVLLRCGLELHPGSMLRFFTPQNGSVWELSKIALWPGILAVLLHHIGRWERGSICAYLLVPAALPVALLFVYWFFHLVCGICSGLLDAAVWVALLAAGCITAKSLKDTAFARQGLFMTILLLCVWVCAYAVFTLHPAQLPIFTESASYPIMSVIAW